MVPDPSRPSPLPPARRASPGPWVAVVLCLLIIAGLVAVLLAKCPPDPVPAGQPAAEVVPPVAAPAIPAPAPAAQPAQVVAPEARP